MGRTKITTDKKRKSLTVNLPNELYAEFLSRGIKNKSKLVQWILEQHFNLIEK